MSKTALIGEAWKTTDVVMEATMLIGVSLVLLTILNAALFDRNNATLLIVIILGHIGAFLFIGYNPMMGTQELASLNDSNLEKVEIIDYSEPKLTGIPEDKGRFFGKIRYQSIVSVRKTNSNVSRVVAVNSNGKVEDAFPIGRTYSGRGFLKLSDHGKTKPDYFVLATYDNNGNVLSENKVHINYTDKKVQKGFAYSKDRHFEVLGGSFF